MGGGGQGGCDRRIEVFVHIKKQLGGGTGGVGVGFGGQGGCERRIEVFVKIQKKKWGGGGGRVGFGGGGQGGCDQKMEVFVKIKKKNWGGGWVEGEGGLGWGRGRVGGVRLDVNEEFKFLGKLTKKKNSGGGGSVAEGVRVDVNAMLGVGGDVGYEGCEPRIEGIVQCTKRYCTILRK